MGSDDIRNENWKQQSAFLFFVEKKSIIDISKMLGVSRKSVGEYLNKLLDYGNEKERRKQENKSNKFVICDSAEPKSIAKMAGYGLHVIGAKKD